ncbi:YadA-like family protein [Streptobacillus felis]|uniref:YadA-like family protein n=1 Tax=Streptobacillus felis TaxID=1384509 RepID=UPI00083030A1|nr:YadA-like family protein [Streptobacillus felis]
MQKKKNAIIAFMLLSFLGYSNYTNDEIDQKINELRTEMQMNYLNRANGRYILQRYDNGLGNDLSRANNSIAYGLENSINGDESLALGYINILGDNNMKSNYSLITGYRNKVYGSNSAVVGSNIKINEAKNSEHGHDIFVLGSNISVEGFKDGIILGNMSVGKENALSIGSEIKKRKIVFLKDGEVSEDSSEAITGKQLYTGESINVEKWKEKLGIGENSVDKPELVILDQKKSNQAGNDVWNGTSNDSFALGHYNIVEKNMDNSIANNTYILGRSNTTSGSFNQVIGYNNKVSGSNSTVIGNNNIVNEGKNSEYGHDVYILGSNINVESNVKDAIILGNDSKAISNALSIGKIDKTRKIVFLSKGEISAESTEAVNGAQLYEEKEERKEQIKALTDNDKKIENKIKNLETNKADRTEVKQLIDEKVDGLVFENSNMELNKKVQEIRKEVTSAIAMANIPSLLPGSKFSIGAAVGTNKGNSAFAMGVNGKLGNFGYKASLGIAGHKNVSFGAGLSYSFGKEEKVNKDLNEKINKLEQEILELKNMLKK